MTKPNFFKQDTLPDVQEAAEGEASPSLPKKIGPYVIESLLGKGGMSLIYLGIHPETHEPLTIKVLLPQYLSHPEMVQRFLKEAQIIGLTNHPNIVKLYGEGEWEGGLYIAMEFIQGISLRQLILQNSLTLKRSLEIVVQIGYALFHLHSHGVIHRDLKPENILLTDSGGVKVIDFGIAQLHTSEERITEKKRIIGTPVYMSPEQKENPLTVSYPADIYSLAIITYELVLGRLSHGVIHLSLIPTGLQRILSQALQPAPKDRYQDIVDFINDISNYLESEHFEKDLRGIDFTTELFEELKNTQSLFLPQSLPNWPRVSIGLINSNPLGLLPIYYEFFDLEDGAYAIILAEPAAKGATALLYAALFKGLIISNRSMLLNPVQLVHQLNTILSHEAIDQIFVMNILILLPIKNQLRYLSCGFGPLWQMQGGINIPKQITANNIALGITAETEFFEVSNNWNVGDRLILHNFKRLEPNDSAGASSGSLTEENFQTALQETLFLEPQKQVEALMRRIKPTFKDSIYEPPMTLISIHRKS